MSSEQEPDQTKSAEDLQPIRRRNGLRASTVQPGAVARVAIRVIRAARAGLWMAIRTILAIIIVFEEWGWRPLAAAIARLARYKPVAWAEAQVAALPPYPALLVFALPSVLLLPLKLLSLWLIAGGHVLAAGSLFVGAKVVGTALVARIFQLTQPALMRLAWFRWLYETLMPWKQALLAWVRESWGWQAARVVKARLRQWARLQWARLKPSLLPLVDAVHSSMRRLLGRR